jgi:serine/threonine protein phosphatase PrpC
MSSRKEKNRRRNVRLFKKAYLAFSDLRIRFQFLTLGIILSSLFIILLAVDNRQLITSKAASMLCDDQSWYCLGECASQSVRKIFTDTWKPKGIDPATRWREEKSGGKPYLCNPSNNPPAATVRPPSPAPSVYSYPTYIPIVVRTTPAPTVTPVNDPQCKNVGNITKLHCCGGSSYCQRHGPGRNPVDSLSYTCDACSGSNICRENYGCIYQACLNSGDKAEINGQYYACFKYGSNPGFLVQVKPEFYNSSYPTNADDVYKNLSVVANAVSSFDQMLARGKIYEYYLSSEANNTLFDKAGVTIVAGLDNLYYYTVGKIGQASSIGLNEISAGAWGDKNAEAYSSYGTFKSLQALKIQEALLSGKDYEDITDFSHLPQMAQLMAAGIARYAGQLTFGLIPGPEKVVNATIDNLAGNNQTDREYADAVVSAITDAINIGYLGKDLINPLVNKKLAAKSLTTMEDSAILNSRFIAGQQAGSPVGLILQGKKWVHFYEGQSLPVGTYGFFDGKFYQLTADIAQRWQAAWSRYNPSRKGFELLKSEDFGRLKVGEIVNTFDVNTRQPIYYQLIKDPYNPRRLSSRQLTQEEVNAITSGARAPEMPNPPRTSTISRVGSFASNVKKGQDAAFATNVSNQIRKAYLVVADGHGVGGEIASQIAVSNFDSYISRFAASSHSEIEVLQSTIKALDDEIVSRTSGGTTFTAAAYRGSDLYIAHMGDSRLYLLRGGKFQPLTQDHHWPEGTYRYDTMVSKSLGDIGVRQVATPGDALYFTTPDIINIKVEPGDILIAGSDGLTHWIDHDRDSFSFIKQAINSSGPEQAAPVIANYAAAAINNGDDVSVAILQIGQ